MGLLKSRTVTLVVAIATLTSNTLSSLLFHQLPDDPYHLATNFGWYLHFANILSVFGFIGALRQHALSIAIFSNYLILDTILCAIPRFLVLGLLQQLSSSICTPSSSPYATKYSSSQVLTFSSSTLVLPEDDYAAPYGLESQLGQLTEGWTQEGCYRIVWLAQLTLAAGVVAATLLQFVGALCVREYAKCLWMKELREEGRLVLEENGVVVIMDGEREDQVSELREKFLLELDVDDN